MADLVSNPMNDVGPETARSEEPREELEDDQQREELEEETGRDLSECKGSIKAIVKTHIALDKE